MSAREQNFELHAGDDRDIYITVYDKNSTAVDLTGASVSWVLADSAVKGKIRSSKTIGDGITLSDQTSHTGEYLVTLGASETALLNQGNYYHESDVSLGGKKSTVVFGQVTIKPSRI